MDQGLDAIDAAAASNLSRLSRNSAISPPCGATDCDSQSQHCPPFPLDLPIVGICIDVANVELTEDAMARFRVGGMKCEGCARKVTSAVQRIALGAEVKVDLPAKVVEIASCVEAATITEVIAAAGFPARSID